ncbi:MAG: DUF4445 domain-containing protein, partial [Clostridia bacterium]|nr:DUF4445 domain-containing protein [Clostridia bacterium]
MTTPWNATIKSASGETVSLCDGTKTLLEIIRDAGIDFHAPCGGNGTCGKCRVHAEGALTPPTQKELSVLSAQELADGVRLACLCRPTGDVTVDLSQQKKFNSVIREEGGLVQAQRDPTVKQVEIRPEKACLERQISMQRRICEALAAVGVTVSSVHPDCLKALPSVLAQQQESCWAVVDGECLLEVSVEKLPVLGVAVDIGTTTVVAYLYDLTTGEQLGVRSALSAQKAFGADVISRIKCATEQGTEPLRNAAVGQLNELIRQVCVQTAPSRVMKMAVCGNPTMQHLLCGLSPETIAAAPFETVSDFGACISAEALGISSHAGANVYVLPSISGYVGGDITAGVIACGMDRGSDVRLMLDIGTNGEMALATPDGIYYCATAAGPAFEGAHIEDGVGGITGAVSSVRAQDGAIRFATIGNAPAVGICGSGIIDAVATLLDVGAVDETGRLCDSDEYDEPYCSMLDEDEGKFILDPASGIGITGKDLREVQLAKAAIA